MPSVLQRLRTFASTRRGQVVLGGSAAAGVAGLALYRRRAGAIEEPGPADGGSAAAIAPPYLQTTGTSGVNTDVTPVPDQGIIDMGQFEDLLTQLGRQSDALEELINRPPADPPTAPPPSPPATPPPSPPTPPTAPPPSTPQVQIPPLPRNMRNGSRGDDVRLLQQRLNTIGFSLAVDGIFGPKTEAAVRHFQSRHAPPVDGIVGPITWSALWRWPNV